jgi:hypothetical protein
MCRFAMDSMKQMKVTMGELQHTLGPETSMLSMRFGLHSGPVTSGVLRGDKSRFQLFGDTVNTAARMESTGQRDRIQVSQSTADLLIASGRSDWINKRDGLVAAKGKGELQTYWLVGRTTSAGSTYTAVTVDAKTTRQTRGRAIHSILLDPPRQTPLSTMVPRRVRLGCFSFSIGCVPAYLYSFHNKSTFGHPDNRLASSTHYVLFI